MLYHESRPAAQIHDTVTAFGPGTHRLVTADRPREAHRFRYYIAIAVFLFV
jgi:hypothetical protein